MTVERQEVHFGTAVVRFTVHRSVKRKQSSLIIDAEEVRVYVPHDVCLETIRDAVRKHAPRILERQKRFVQAKRLSDPPKCFVSGECVRYLGRQYILKRFAGTTQPKAVLRGRFFELHARNDEEARATIHDWYRTRGSESLPQRVALWADRLGVVVSDLRMGDQRRRWGSCTSNGVLRLNWRVMMMPWVLIDYVIVHELCHLLEANHSKTFWVRMRQVMPDYPVRQERLMLEGNLFSGA
jgi:predicted metal-dependent hydrolase